MNRANAQEGYIAGVKQQGHEDTKSPPVITGGVRLSHSDMLLLSGASLSTNTYTFRNIQGYRLSDLHCDEDSYVYSIALHSTV